MSDILKRKPAGRKRTNKDFIVPYSREESNIFETVMRPRVNLSLYSEVLSQWIAVDDVLADTGADLSLLPRSLGVLLVGNIRRGKRFRITGLVSNSVRYFYLHPIKVKLGAKKFNAAFAIAAGDDIPPTLGRISALDRMNIEYKKGRLLSITW